VKGKIEFKDVWFRYPTRRDHWVLRGINFTISHKETIGLVGESGAGKSTITLFLFRFYDPQFYRFEIKEYNLHSLRFCFGLV
jgi:ATP-binding cassette subfamily B (MDR/TAP) protein 1